MRISPILYGTFVLLIFLGIIGWFKAAGVWSVSGKITSGGEAVQPQAGDVDSIKGWMTLEQIITIYDVPLADLLAHFNLPADTPASSAIKDLESEEFSVTNLRDWLQDGSEPTPEATFTTPAADPAVVSATPTGLAATPTLVIPVEPIAATPLASEHVVADKTITGKTTFQELIDWGVPEETIRQIIGGDLPVLSTVVKDFAIQQGSQFSTVKTALQAEVDKTR
jgi:hypothetical protein